MLLTLVCGCCMGFYGKTYVRIGGCGGGKKRTSAEGVADMRSHPHDQVLVCASASARYHTSVECGYVKRSNTMKTLTQCTRCRDLQHSKGE